MARLHFVLLLVLVSRLAAAQPATVPLDDPAYQDIDRIIGNGLVQHPYSSQRPYTRWEFARMILSAKRSTAAQPPNGATRRILDRLARRFAREVDAQSGGERVGSSTDWRWRTELNGLSSPARGIPDDSTGSVVASINPLTNNRLGRELRDGMTGALEVEYDRGFSNGLRLRVRPRFAAVANAGEADAFGSLQSATASVKLWRIVTEVGRQDLLLGTGMESGLVSSSSSRPLDMIRFTNDEPIRVPILSRIFFGPTRGNLVIADLGSRQRFPHSLLIGYKLASLPSDRFEIAGTVVAVQLGRGAPRTTGWQHVMDLIPALKYTLEDDTTQFSNKLAGWEYRLRIPELRGLQLYVEHAFDDMDPRRWKSTFWEDAGHVAGASLQNLAGDGALSGALEFHHTGVRYYQHAVFTTGYAFNGSLIGNPLGTDADGAYLRLRWDEGRTTAWVLDAAVERRGGNVYTAVVDNPQNDNFRFVVVEAHPPEWRHRLVGSWTRDVGGRRVIAQAGIERVRDFSFVSGAARWNVLLGMTVDAYRR